VMHLKVLNLYEDLRFLLLHLFIASCILSSVSVFLRY